MAGDPYSGNARLVGLTDVLLRDLVHGFIFQSMRRWAACLWALPSILLCVEPVCAQLPRGLEGCSPASQAAAGETPRPPRIIVDDVRIGSIDTSSTRTQANPAHPGSEGSDGASGAGMVG